MAGTDWMPHGATEVAPDSNASGWMPQGATEIPQQDNTVSGFERQMTKGMYDHVPFGKDAIRTFTPDKESGIAGTTDPRTWDEKLGRFVGSGLGMLPAFAGGETLAGAAVKGTVEGAGAIGNMAVQSGNAANIAKAAKLGQVAKGFQGTAQLAGGAAAIGTQSGVEDKTAGASTGEAFKKGAIDAGVTFAGGKALEGVGAVISNLPKNIQWTASRINNSVIKPQLKDLRFGKDPGGFLSRNVTSPDNTLEGWKGATEQAVDAKVQQAKDIVAGKPKAVVNVKEAIDKVYAPAMDEAAKVGDENLLQQLVKDRQTIENQQVVVKDPQTGEVSIGSAGKRNLENLPLSDAIDLKRTIGKLTTDWTKGSEYLKALQSTRRQAYGAVRNATEQVAPELGAVNSDIADGISAKNAISRRMDVEQRQNMLGLYSVGGGAMFVHGVFSGNVGTIASGLAVMGGDAVMRSPYLMSRVAYGLSKISSTADKINLMNAVPWLKENYNKIMQHANDNVGAESSGLESMPGKNSTSPTPEGGSVSLFDRMKQAKLAKADQIKQSMQDFNQGPYKTGIAEEAKQARLKALESNPMKEQWKNAGQDWEGSNRGQASVPLVASTAAGTALAASQYQKVNPLMKSKISKAENNGKPTGDWAQLTDTVLTDLKQQGKLDKSVTMPHVKADSKLYDHVVSLYLKRMDAFGIPEKDKALWWLMPGRYKKAGGDIEKIDDPKLRNIMRNRVKNMR